MEMEGSQELLHRVFEGTPEKVAKRRLLEISASEGKPVFRATQVSMADIEDLQDGEVLITYRKLTSELEECTALARSGCTEIVIVMEALFLLQDAFDEEYVSLGSMRDFVPHVELLTHGIPFEGKPTFSRFCYSLWKYLAEDNKTSPLPLEKGVGKGKRIAACTPTSSKEKERFKAFLHGKQLYVSVCEAVAEKEPGNEALQAFVNFDVKLLRAWVELYYRRVERHVKSHPFKCIGGDTVTAICAVSVLEYAQYKEAYGAISPLIKAAVPFITRSISNEKRTLQNHAAKLDTQQMKAQQRMEELLDSFDNFM